MEKTRQVKTVFFQDLFFCSNRNCPGGEVFTGQKLSEAKGSGKKSLASSKI
jgi:hypothetical protein